MEDKDIDKFFSDDLSREYPYEPKAGDWTKVAQDLDLKDHLGTQNRELTRLGLPLLLAALICGILGYGWWHSHQTLILLSQKVSDLETQITESKTQILRPAQEAETKVYAGVSESASFSTSILSGNSTQWQVVAPDLSQKRNAWSERTVELTKSIDSVFDGIVAQEDTAFMGTDPKDSNVQALPPIGIDSVVLSNKNPSIPLLEIGMPPKIVPQKTTRWGLGIISAFYGGDHHRESHMEGKSIGVSGQYWLNRRWQIRSGLSFELAHSSQRPPFDELDIPIPNPPAPGYVLDHRSARQMGATFSTGLRRDFFAHKRLHPYLCTDLSGTWFFEENSAFLFEANTSGEPHLTLMDRDRQDNLQANIQLGLGIAFKIRPQLALHLEGGWQSGLSEHQGGRQFLSFSILKYW